MTRRALAIDALGNVGDAAPELYEALERITALESHNPSVATADDLLRTAKRIALAALAKVRGDAQ